jgi:hypothetical protein
MTCVGTGIGEAMCMKRCAQWAVVIQGDQKETHVQMTVGDHNTVDVKAGIPKAMKNAARRMPRRRSPPVTAHVLMVKTTVNHRSAPGKEKTRDVIVLAFC